MQTVSGNHKHRDQHIQPDARGQANADPGFPNVLQLLPYQHYLHFLYSLQVWHQRLVPDAMEELVEV